MGVIFKRVTGCVKFVGTSLVRAMSRKVHEHENDKDSVCCCICFDISVFFFRRGGRVRYGTSYGPLTMFRLHKSGRPRAQILIYDRIA